MNNINIFSIHSGLYYQVPENHFNMLDGGQIPLKKTPANCKICYSRGYTGFNSQSFTYSICKCVEKNTDYDRIKLKFNIQSTSV